MAFEFEPLTFNEFIVLTKKHNPKANIKLIEKSYRFAAAAHQGQRRKSGEVFFIHPVETARILIGMKADSATICAALLHDTVEDTSTSLEKVKNEFGSEVANLVEGVTKVLGVKFSTKEEYKAENIKKILLAATRDVRVLLIRLADRLHNMRTLSSFREDKRKRIAKETLEIYAPIAHKLGIWRLKGELEDLSFRHLNYPEYIKLKEQIADKRAVREKVTQEIVSNIRTSLERKGIRAEVVGRAKYFYSIYKKMIKKKRSFDQIYDLMAIRIITRTVPECYKSLEVVHSLYQPRLDRVKDFIEHPKANGYQSIHTTVIRGNKMIEVQIRTRKMHDIAEEGIAAEWRISHYKNAAHWKYKGVVRDDFRFDRRLMWIKQILDWKRQSQNAMQFVETLKIDLFENETIVLTPKGDPISLPKGATSIDFAYAVHSAVGNQCSKAKVNGVIKPLDYVVNSGDIVEIITQKNARPSRNWLNFVKTGKARGKIRASLGIEIEQKTSDEKIVKKLSNHQLMTLIHVEGKKHPLKISHCCAPDFGDPLVGFLTKDQKITVHREDCINIHTLDKNKKSELKWKPLPESNLRKLKVFIRERPRILADILNLLASEKINVKSVNTRSKKQKIMLTFKIEPHIDLDWEDLIHKTEAIAGVLDTIID